MNHGLEAIEFDIWITKDEIPIVLHGGDNGELNHHFSGETGMIFEKTLTELLSFELDQSQKIPTLE